MHLHVRFGSKADMAASQPALPPKADMDQYSYDVRFMPKADILHCSKERRYSITSSARTSSERGIVRLSAFAVLGFTQRKKYGRRRGPDCAQLSVYYFPQALTPAAQID